MLLTSFVRQRYLGSRAVCVAASCLLATISSESIASVVEITPAVIGSDVSGFAFSPDGNRIAYLADGRTNGINKIYLAANPLTVPEPNSLAISSTCLLSRTAPSS